MISHPVSHLLPELLLASWAVGLLILDMSGTSPKLRHSFTMAALAISSLAVVFSFSLPSFSLFNGLLYTSNWSSFLKLVLLILTMLTWQLRPNASTNQQPAFFLIILLLGAFILISATNLWLLLICYFWCLISLFFINAHFFEKVTEAAERQWLQIGLISALIMAFGVVSYLLVVKEANWFLTPVDSIPRLTIPTVLILSGLRYLVLNNYPPKMAEASSFSTIVNLIFIPFLEIILLIHLLLPALNYTGQAMVFPIIGIYGLGLGLYTIFKAQTSSSKAQFLLQSLPIQNSFVLIAFAGGDSYDFALGMYYSLFYLFSILVLLTTEETRGHEPLRFTAWFNLAGLPLTPGFALRLEMILANRNLNFVWIGLVIIYNLMTFWVYTHKYQKNSFLKISALQSPNRRTSPFWQWLLVLFFVLNGILWRIPLSWLTRLFSTISPY
jgi:hypothetical protein